MCIRDRFEDGISVRCRSSTNNEDLPGFSGAGLYDSKTQHPHEGHISKSVKQVYASIWNFRAYDERDFYKIDHLKTAMGILCHQNFEGEIANGVGVTTDPIYDTEHSFYLSSQLGEDLVTNPNNNSVSEEVILPLDTSITSSILIRSSNQVARGERIITSDHLNELRENLIVINDEFRDLYDAESLPGFAMEIEFKITKDNLLNIKQARPWSQFWRSANLDELDESEQLEPSIKVIQNPVNAFSSIEFELQNAERVTLEIRNLAQQLIYIQDHQTLNAGHHEISFGQYMEQKASGLYIIRLLIGNRSSSHLIVKP